MHNYWHTDSIWHYQLYPLHFHSTQMKEKVWNIRRLKSYSLEWWCRQVKCCQWIKMARLCHCRIFPFVVRTHWGGQLVCPLSLSAEHYRTSLWLCNMRHPVAVCYANNRNPRPTQAPTHWQPTTNTNKCCWKVLQVCRWHLDRKTQCYVGLWVTRRLWPPGHVSNQWILSCNTHW